MTQGLTKHYSRGREYRNKVEALYERGIVRGTYCGFETLHEHYTIQRGSTTYVYGAPFSGKSEFWFELLLNLTELYGWKHAIYSPESGNREEITAEIISKKCRKPFYRQIEGCLTESELIRELDWFDEFFFIVDPSESDLSVEQFYQQVDQLESEYELRVDTTACDPFNELKHDFGSDGRQDLYIENKLGFIRRNAKNKNRHNAILTHCTDQAMIKGRDVNGNEKWFYPPPSPRQLAGGQAWYRKAMMMICNWRPPEGIVDEKTGVPYEINESHIIIQKFKPKFTGKKGLVKLYYDATKNRYYEKYNGQNRYAGKQHQVPVRETFEF